MFSSRPVVRTHKMLSRESICNNLQTMDPQNIVCRATNPFVVFKWYPETHKMCLRMHLYKEVHPQTVLGETKLQES